MRSLSRVWKTQAEGVHLCITTYLQGPELRFTAPAYESFHEQDKLYQDRIWLAKARPAPCGLNMKVDVMPLDIFEQLTIMYTYKDATQRSFVTSYRLQKQRRPLAKTADCWPARKKKKALKEKDTDRFGTGREEALESERRGPEQGTLEPKKADPARGIHLKRTCCSSSHRLGHHKRVTRGVGLQPKNLADY
eukprot:1160574-Pelagomonas_calceolata.AAC.4